MVSMGCKQSQGDHALFVKHSASGRVTVLLVYVDDIIVTGDDLEGMESLKKQLDIAYAVSVVSQFMRNPKESHLKAVYRILQYLKGTLGRGILFKKGEGLTLEAYTDADYAVSVINRRSTSGYCTFLGGNLVTWRSKKQNVVARSSAEAEFRAMTPGICELLWLRIILEDLKVRWEGLMKLYCDNKSAINIAHNHVQHDRTKHIEVE
ncbi:secreted RxLR effector protein 161-like [Cornus florida]|uniref:secreted RxLR effector protein 161-like n=1 Tax=Cornus florida TaxID=4283 RepID=UPI00289E3AF5|nr:secreted RxLR effector protein 161-like [Cornus florida]